jgi:hypothetical protein
MRWKRTGKKDAEQDLFIWNQPANKRSHLIPYVDKGRCYGLFVLTAKCGGRIASSFHTACVILATAGTLCAGICAVDSKQGTTWRARRIVDPKRRRLRHRGAFARDVDVEAASFGELSERDTVSDERDSRC